MDRIDDESSSVNDAASEDAEGASSTTTNHVDAADQVVTAADLVDHAAAAGADDDDAAMRGPRAAEFEKLVRSVARDNAPPDAPAAPAAAEAPKLSPDAIAAGHVPIDEPDPAATAGGTPCIWVSVTLKLSTTCTAVLIEVAKLAAFMNALGTAAYESNFFDVQIYLQRRRGRKASEHVQIFGLILDIDMTSVDPLGRFLDAGLPLPTCWWPTRHGFKGAWAFNRSVDIELFTMIAQEFAVAVLGADPGSWRVTQAQHLPIGWKDTPGGFVKIELPALQSNGMPFDVNSHTPTLPYRLARALAGAKTLTDMERQQVEDWLAERGIDAPDTPGRAVYDSCPASDKHDATCCYVYRQEDGSIDITCHGGHDGEGKKFWSEIALYREATGEQLNHTEIDALDDVPFTWAGIAFVKSEFEVALAGEEFAQAIIEIACVVWQRAKAARRLVWLRAKARAQGLQVDGSSLASVLKVYAFKLGNPRGLRMVYHHGRNLLGHVRVDQAFQRTTCGSSLSLKEHTHEWYSTLAVDVDLQVVDEEERIAVICEAPASDGTSSWNKVVGGGDPTFLTALGIPVAELYDLPIAHLKAGWSIDPATGCLRWVRTARLKPGDATFDVVGFFLRLFKEGKLPLASEDDVRRFVIAVAIGLLRTHLPGQIGVFWFIGPSGAGKDWLAYLLVEIWRAAVESAPAVSFDVHGTDDLEQSRCFASADDAVFARAREAGKRAALIDRLIQFAGTSHVTARDMGKLARNIPNTFVYVADSVEDLPERREISRRTVTINVEPVADTSDRGEVTAAIVAHAPDIIASLLRIVESKPIEFYTKYPNKSSRPTLPVALADVFGTVLPEVTGASLVELFGHIAAYCKNFAQSDEDKPKGRKKDGVETTLFPVHRMTHMIDVMGAQAGSRQFFRQHDSPRKIQLRIQQELQDRKKKYIRVMVEGAWHAFRIVPKTNNFIFETEIEFRTKMGLGPDDQGATLHDGDENESGDGDNSGDDNANDAQGQPSRNPSSTSSSASSISQAGQRKGPLRFSSSALKTESTKTKKVPDAT